ncbi:MAG: uroporphyrin-III methyltransferase [Eubacterium sp.]|nr:uroporphyrin-III methyltransferase [Eubacterium sp.]
MGIFDEKKPFDFNGDGKMSAFENAKKEAYFMHVISESGKKGSQSDEFLAKLREVGLDVDELQWMEDEERDEKLRNAGIDPDEWDFNIF